MRFQEFGAYAPMEAALWGVAHRDSNRCRDQFTKCPSTAEAFITELNSTPGIRENIKELNSIVIIKCHN